MAMMIGWIAGVVHRRHPGLAHWRSSPCSLPFASRLVGWTADRLARLIVDDGEWPARLGCWSKFLNTPSLVCDCRDCHPRWSCSSFFFSEGSINRIPI